jgi:hypothetical protein
LKTIITNKDKTKGVICETIDESNMDDVEDSDIQIILNPTSAFLRLASNEELKLYHQLAYGEP